jgi:hypothetical protein
MAPAARVEHVPAAAQVSGTPSRKSRSTCVGSVLSMLPVITVGVHDGVGVGVGPPSVNGALTVSGLPEPPNPRSPPRILNGLSRYAGCPVTGSAGASLGSCDRDVTGPAGSRKTSSAMETAPVEDGTTCGPAGAGPARLRSSLFLWPSAKGTKPTAKTSGNSTNAPRRSCALINRFACLFIAMLRPILIRSTYGVGVISQRLTASMMRLRVVVDFF